ncbi:hypothetical protein LJC58_00395 [Lachnospiraceae bacterium OttesenSCG-928-D06]|nr:hypothetical protein [Lachnospiraceae bacterium OttesenSCG-928-D06]
MKKALIKAAVFIIVFFATLITGSRFMNQGNNNLSMEMAPASFPVITMETGGISYNQLHGYAQVMETAYQRQHITELGSNRDYSFTIDTYGEAINGISIELRTTDGQRLIENTVITDYEISGESIYVKSALKDLMEADTEYILVILLDTESNHVIRYYTRVIWSENTFAIEKIRFVKAFHEALYDKERASELIKYLESNSLGDNSSFHKVTINSSFQQITWGELQVEEVGTPVIQLRELASQTASLVVEYTVMTKEGTTPVMYQVEEFFRIRYTPERTYLLSYERTMIQIPDVTADIFVNDKIVLGIIDENVPFVESEDGNIVVFEAAKQLCSYNITTNKLTVVFSFYDKKNEDKRTTYNQHNIKILDVDEGGNVRFAVYGYMNRGRHEGSVGIQIYYYDASRNTVEEAVYIPYDKTYAVLCAELNQLLYMNRDNKLYFFLENNVYGVDLIQKTYEKIVVVEYDDSLQVSENHKILVWQEGKDKYHSTKLMVKNLNSGTENAIVTNAGDVIRLLGFMGEDIIYGIAREEDVEVWNTGRVFYPMYKICIQDSEGELLKEYMQEEIYVTDCVVVDNQITLERVKRLADGSFAETTKDQIMNNIENQEGKNKLVTVSIDKYGKYVQIQVRNTIDTKTLKILTPKEVVFEGVRGLDLEAQSEVPRYYVYSANEVTGIYNSPANAINLAYANAGVVMNENGDCIWLKGNRATRNQIMAIKEPTPLEEESSLAVCLDTILKFEGIVRNCQHLLNQGMSVTQILSDSLEDVQVMELTGCNLDSVLYYVNQDIPVLATLGDGEAVLITGFNEQNVVIFEPSTGRLYKKGMKDSTEWFAENGNDFITYIRQE